MVPQYLPLRALTTAPVHEGGVIANHKIKALEEFLNLIDRQLRGWYGADITARQFQVQEVEI
jgi:hypothetical protein